MRGGVDGGDGSVGGGVDGRVGGGIDGRVGGGVDGRVGGGGMWGGGTRGTSPSPSLGKDFPFSASPSNCPNIYQM